MIEIKNVSKIYNMGKEKVIALDNISLTIKEGEFTAIVGPSGSGKSTLMHLVGGLDTPTSGSIFVDGKDISKFKREDLVGFYSKYYVPNNCHISVVSSYEHEKVYQLIHKYFNKWRSKEVKHNDIIFEYNTPCKKVSFKKDIEQSTVLYLFTFNGLSEKQELALRILNHKFGGSNNSILFTKLREERGLAYDVYTDLDLDEGVKTLYVYTSVGEENLKEAVDVIEDCIDKVKNGDIIFKDDMLSLMKKVLKTAVVFTLEDPTDIGNYVLNQSMKGEDIYKLINDIERIETIKKEDMYEVAKIVFNNPTIHILKRG